MRDHVVLSFGRLLLRVIAVQVHQMLLFGRYLVCFLRLSGLDGACVGGHHVLLFEHFVRA